LKPHGARAGGYTLSAVDIFGLGLVLFMARASRLSAAAVVHHLHQMFMRASTAGFANEDDSAVIRLFGHWLPKT
jgi:3-hydroxyisobutyrate dehydrogenase